MLLRIPLFEMKTAATGFEGVRDRKPPKFTATYARYSSATGLLKPVALGQSVN
jgi:hypothetical protein